jgi:COP9 signalosome complex subunit 5
VLIHLAVAQVMGMMQGRIVPYHDSSENKEKGIFMVLDAFALPVEGTETRVNAQEEAYEYMVEYKQRQDEIGREENVVGWYHSHPGYGCWLSGIDVQTQRTNQTYQEPFVAIVVDPVRTVAAGKVELGAFRTLPQGNRERACSDIPGKSKSKQTSSEEVPLHKVEDFGVHAEEYYSLPVECFRTELDGRLFHLLWREYWAGALAGTSEARFMRTQVTDVASKLEKAVQQTSGSRAVDAARGGARAAVERSKGAAARAAAAEALGDGGL